MVDLTNEQLDATALAAIRSAVRHAVTHGCGDPIPIGGGVVHRIRRHTTDDHHITFCGHTFRLTLQEAYLADIGFTELGMTYNERAVTCEKCIEVNDAFWAGRDSGGAK